MESLRQREDQILAAGYQLGVFRSRRGPEERPGPGDRGQHRGGFTARDRHRIGHRRCEAGLSLSARCRRN